LPDLRVAGISVDYSPARRVDEHGNAFRYQAQVYGTPNSRVVQWRHGRNVHLVSR
jgi:hypothetical protein